MNDPHVVALLYRVRHNESVDYGKALALVVDEPGFRIEVKNGTARLEMKGHYATVEDARRAVDPFLRNWEFEADLERGFGSFGLEFDRAEIIDRRPIKNVVEISSVGRAEWSIDIPEAKITLYPRTYPTPPSTIDSDHPDVQTLYQRYKSFCQGKEPLTTFAYFCLTVMEHSIGLGRGLRRKASDKYGIDKRLLDEMGRLSSIEGGSEARKASGTGHPLTQDERQFLKRAVVRMIRRVAEYHAGTDDLPKITIQDINGEV